MKLRDLIHPERGPQNLVRLAIYALVVLVTFSVVAAILNQMSGTDLFLGFLFILLLSPLAYFIRESRSHRTQRHTSRRGAERRPMMPPNEEQQ